MNIKYILFIITLLPYHIVKVTIGDFKPMIYLSVNKFTTLPYASFISFFRVQKGCLSTFVMYCTILYILQIPLTESGLFFRVDVSV